MAAEWCTEATWQALKAKREGELTSADELGACVDTSSALDGLVAAALPVLDLSPSVFCVTHVDVQLHAEKMPQSAILFIQTGALS